MDRESTANAGIGIEAEIRAAQIEAVYQHRTAINAGTLIASTLLSAVVWEYVASAWIVTWWGLVNGMSRLRVAVRGRYLRSRGDAAKMRRWSSTRAALSSWSP